MQAENNLTRDRVMMFGSAVSQLTPDERRQLHDWLEKRRPIR